MRFAKNSQSVLWRRAGLRHPGACITDPGFRISPYTGIAKSLSVLSQVLSVRLFVIAWAVLFAHGGRLANLFTVRLLHLVHCAAGDISGDISSSLPRLDLCFGDAAILQCIAGIAPDGPAFCDCCACACIR